MEILLFSRLHVIFHHVNVCVNSIQGLSKLTLIEEPKKRATSAARQRQAVPEAAVYSRSTAPSVCMTFITLVQMSVVQEREIRIFY